MSEAFVNTLKRDYVYTNDCFDADTVLKMLPGWIEDYNNIAPHSGLGMQSPVEYRKLLNQGV
jgi:putative transposase